MSGGIFDEKPTVVDGAVDGARSGIDRHKPQEAIFQQFQEERLDFGIASDGLPVPIIKAQLPYAPVLSRDNLICMGDESSFVIRDEWGVVWFSIAKEDVERTPSGRWRVSVNKLIELGACERLGINQEPKTAGRKPKSSNNEELRFQVSTELRLQLHLKELDENWVEVEPIRKQCLHYARQMMDFSDNPEGRMVERLCTARRDSGGEFLSLQNSCMYACELREPPHIPTIEKCLDSFDENKIMLGLERTEKETETFDVEAALSAMGEEK